MNTTTATENSKPVTYLCQCCKQWTELPLGSQRRCEFCDTVVSKRARQRTA
jgi:hypothetical protein